VTNSVQRANKESTYGALTIRRVNLSLSQLFCISNALTLILPDSLKTLKVGTGYAKKATFGPAKKVLVIGATYILLVLNTLISDGNLQMLLLIL